MVIAKVSLPIPFLPDMTVVWLVLLFFSLLCAIYKGGIKIDYGLLFFVLLAALGLFVMKPEPFFRSSERLIGFVINIALLSPLLSSPFLNSVKMNLFSYTLSGLKIIMFASFVAYFLGINLANKEDTDPFWAFSGITNQSMVLAPISAMCLIHGVWSLITQCNSKIYSLFLIVQCLCSIWCIIVAGSRGSMIGAIVSIAVLFYCYGSYKKFFLCVIVFLTSYSFLPSDVLDKAFYTINIKQENNEISVSSVTSTRDEKWNARINEFLESPVFGCGFASQTNYTEDDDKSYIKKTGGLEPGSSWLCIFAMTGILGFLTLGVKIIKQSLQIWRASQSDINAIFLLSLWIFYLFNGAFEGWIFYSGGFVFYLWWLLYGILHANTGKDVKFEI